MVRYVDLTNPGGIKKNLRGALRKNHFIFQEPKKGCRDQ